MFQHYSKCHRIRPSISRFFFIGQFVKTISGCAGLPCKPVWMQILDACQGFPIGYEYLN